MTRTLAAVRREGREVKKGDLLFGYTTRDGEMVVLSMLRITKIFNDPLELSRRMGIHVVWSNKPMVLDGLEDLLIENDTEYLVGVDAPIYGEVELKDPRAVTT